MFILLVRISVLERYQEQVRGLMIHFSFGLVYRFIKNKKYLLTTKFKKKNLKNAILC